MHRTWFMWRQVGAALTWGCLAALVSGNLCAQEFEGEPAAWKEPLMDVMGSTLRLQNRLDESVAALESLRTQNAALAAEVARLSAADDATSGATDPAIAHNIAWILLTGFLVMLMQAGFGLLEVGFCRAKNAAHTMAMNFADYCCGILAFWVCGFALMFGGTGAAESVSTITTLGPEVGEYLNQSLGFWLGPMYVGLAGNAGHLLADPALFTSGIFALFLFQLMFCDTAVTIPTGALAERWRMGAVCLTAFGVAGFIYPIYGHWVWGGGWLAALGKNVGLGHGVVDFAGSSVVHMVGGLLGLVGAWHLGPRIGKFDATGQPRPIPGHNIPFAFVGAFILAFGWFGFNCGSSLAYGDSQVGIIATNTLLASGAGAVAAMLSAWRRFGVPDCSFTINGLLAGLVGVTAPCAFVDAWAAVVIGAVAGSLVVASAVWVEEHWRLDDPCGAISVHGVCGAWGLLAVGIFANGRYGAGWNSVGAETYLGRAVVSGQSGGVTGLLYGDASQLVAQGVGLVACLVWTTLTMTVLYRIVEALVGNRPSAEAELAGLDVVEVGTSAYPEET